MPLILLFGVGAVSLSSFRVYRQLPHCLLPKDIIQYARPIVIFLELLLVLNQYSHCTSSEQCDSHHSELDVHTIINSNFATASQIGDKSRYYQELLSLLSLLFSWLLPCHLIAGPVSSNDTKLLYAGCAGALARLIAMSALVESGLTTLAFLIAKASVFWEDHLLRIEDLRWL